MKLIHNRGLTPIPCARRVEPSRSLADGDPWVHSADTNIALRFLAMRARTQKPANVKSINQRKKA